MRDVIGVIDKINFVINKIIVKNNLRLNIISLLDIIDKLLF